METPSFTDIMIFGIKDGICRGAAWKQAGAKGDRFNRKTVTEWVMRGWDIQTFHKDDPQAKVLYDQLWDNAKATIAVS